VNLPKVDVRAATLDDLDVLVVLFDGYRQFYRQTSDLERAREFLADRLARRESTIFLACAGGRAVGFTQLYPSFSSVAMAPVLILNDLFVAAEARRSGAGAALLQAAADYGRSVGAVRLVLSTEVDNATAQSVYERNGWRRDTRFVSYQLAL
jgi:ribosomal protein S18 acetylase RimI-like enzyme